MWAEREPHLATLRRMFNLARRENKLSVVPYFPMDAENKPDKLFLPPKRFDRSPWGLAQVWRKATESNNLVYL